MLISCVATACLAPVGVTRVRRSAMRTRPELGAGVVAKVVGPPSIRIKHLLTSFATVELLVLRDREERDEEARQISLAHPLRGPLPRTATRAIHVPIDLVAVAAAPTDDDEHRALSCYSTPKPSRLN